MMGRKEKKRPPTIAERIVDYFTREVSEAHIMAICRRLDIDEDQFRLHIADARDLKIGPGFRLTPIYERQGWWTRRPTERIMAIALREAIRRNVSEQLRNARVYSGTRLDSFARFQAATLQGAMAAYLDTHVALLTIDADLDYILNDVDRAISRGRVIVRNS